MSCKDNSLVRLSFINDIILPSSDSLLLFDKKATETEESKDVRFDKTADLGRTTDASFSILRK